MISKRNPILIVLMLVLAVGTANAATISYEQTIAKTAITWTTGVGGVPALNLNQFNPALGTLTSVLVQLWSDANISLFVSNDMGTTLTYTNVSGSIPLVLTGPAFTSITSTASLNLNFSPAESINDGELDSYVGNSILANTSTSFSSGMAPYIGTGFVGSLSAAGGDASAGGTGGAGLGWSANGSVGGTVKITYTYDSAIPEPMSFTLIGSGLFALGWWVRRKYTTR